MMIKIKIEDKDFYEAYHILNRASSIEIKKEVMEEWKMFLEGTLSMMKKKYKEGIAILETLLALPMYAGAYESISGRSGRERFVFIKPLIYLYKAYGELSEGSIKTAKEDYCSYNSLCAKLGLPSDNLSKHYNTLIL
jgi:hypothetical protein